MKNEEIHIFFILLDNYSPEGTGKGIMKEKERKKKNEIYVVEQKH